MIKSIKKVTLLMPIVVLFATTGCAPFFHGGPGGGGGGHRFAEQQPLFYENKGEDVHQAINEMMSQHNVNQEKEAQLVTSLN